MQVSDESKQRKLPQHDFGTPEVYQTPSSFRVLTWKTETIDGKSFSFKYEVLLEIDNMSIHVSFQQFTIHYCYIVLYEIELILHIFICNKQHKPLTVFFILLIGYLFFFKVQTKGDNLSHTFKLNSLTC